MRATPSTALLAAVLAATSLAAVEETPETPTVLTCWTDTAGTEDPADDVEVCPEQNWFHRADTPFGNVEAVAAEAVPSWDTNPPAGSVTGGNGGGYAGNSVLDLAVPGDPNNAATFQGTFTGTLDNLAVSLYAWVPVRTVTEADHEIHLMLDYDGVRVLDIGDLPIVTTRDGESTVRIDFVIDGLGQLVDLFGFENGPDSVHDLTLKIGVWHHGSDEAVYLYDSSEVPSSITFNANPDGFADYTVVDAF